MRRALERCLSFCSSASFKTSVPSRHVRGFSVDKDVTCIAPNELPVLAPQFDQLCVSGAGKTAMDFAPGLMTIPESKAIIEKLGANLMPAMTNLQKLIEQTSVER